MRDAFGGTFLMYMIITFVTLFVVFMAETLKYVQAYRVKNTIINYIEQYEGFDENVQQILDKEQGIVYKSGYSAKAPCTPNSTIPKKSGETYCSNYGYTVEMKYTNGSQAYYKVTTYITLDFTQVLFMETSFKIPVSGETRLVTIG